MTLSQYAWGLSVLDSIYSTSVPQLVVSVMDLSIACNGPVNSMKLSMTV